MFLSNQSQLESNIKGFSTINKPKSVFGGISSLHKQQYYDMQKREYCKKHGIKLILIPYWDENKIDYDYIMNLADTL